MIGLRRSLTLTVALAGLLVGCQAGPNASAEVRRLLMTPGEDVHHFNLSSTNAAFAVSPDGGSARVLLRFPLPGSQGIRPAYAILLRLHLPPGSQTVLAGQDEPVFAALARRRGEVTHAWTFNVGELSVRWVDGGRLLAGRFALVASEGLRIEGQFRAGRDEQPVFEFERRTLTAIARRAGHPVAVLATPANSQPDLDAPLILLHPPTSMPSER